MPEYYPTQTAHVDSETIGNLILAPADRVWDEDLQIVRQGDGTTAGGLKMPPLAAEQSGALLTTIPTGDSRVVPNNYQVQYFNSLTVYGTLDVYGALRVV